MYKRIDHIITTRHIDKNLFSKSKELMMLSSEGRTKEKHTEGTIDYIKGSVIAINVAAALPTD